MATLVAILSSGKGTWARVSNLIKAAKWDNVYLLCNEFAYSNFDIHPSKALKLKFDEKNVDKSLRVLSDFFKKQVKDFEVAVNLSSGTGEEHMLILSAVLKSGLGVRFVRVVGNEVKEYELLDEKFDMKDDF